MTKKNRRRLDMLERVNRELDVPLIVKTCDEKGYSVEEVADCYIKLEDAFSKELGGRPRFTGSTRVYKGGAIGYEVRCLGCDLKFWVTVLPYAYCPDCDPSAMFRH
mgnify:CR=1 FL=1